MTLSCFDAAAEAPGRAAIVAEGVAYSYGALAERVRVAAGWLHAQGPLPERAALTARADLDSVVMLHALIALGVPVVVVHPRWTLAERRRVLEEMAPVFSIDESWRTSAEACPAPVAFPGIPDDGRCLAVVYTSGTSGGTRGVELSRASFCAAAQASAANLGWREGDRWLLSLSFAHVGGLSVLTRCLAARRTVVLGPTDSLQATIDREQVTVASLVPTQLAQLLHRTPRWDPPARVRALLVGGAATSTALLEESADRRWPVLTTYGLTEACSQVTTQESGTVNRGEKGNGAPLPGVEVRIVEGVIQVRGPTLFTRYVPSGDARRMDEGGWFLTGDLGRMDEEGRLHVLGRKDDVIVTGGEKVLPQEVEEALRRCPGIVDACVFGASDKTWGQVVCAVLVPSAGAPSDLKLAHHLGTSLAAYKRPRRIAYVSAFPLNRSGKVDRHALADQCARALKPLQTDRS